MRESVEERQMRGYFETVGGEVTFPKFVDRIMERRRDAKGERVDGLFGRLSRGTVSVDFRVVVSRSVPLRLVIVRMNLFRVGVGLGMRMRVLRR